MLAALQNRGIPAAAFRPNSITEMVTCLHSQACHWFYMSVLGTTMARHGSCHTRHEYVFRGVLGEHLQLGDSGMPSIGKKRPNSCYRCMLIVIDEDLDYKFFGIYSGSRGGAGPRQWVQAFEERVVAMERQRPVDVPDVIRLPMSGQCPVRNDPRLKWRTCMPHLINCCGI